MKTNTLGRTGLEISELVFGGGFVGGILLHASDAIRREAIQRALDGGVNWIDTAASYGNGQSEEVLGCDTTIAADGWPIDQRNPAAW